MASLGVREVPPLLRLVGHPLRWMLLTELARSDRQVAELSNLLGIRQSLVSYHVGRLRSEGLVVARRSSRDARQTFYRADLNRCGESLVTSARALHPSLAPPRIHAGDDVSHDRVPLVLFLCTGNSARSQMAEALANTGGGMQAVSAGDRIRPVHPNAVRAMARRGLDIRRQRAKPIDVFTHSVFDHVVTLCDQVRERCPDFPGAVLSHWSVPDPVGPGTDEETLPAFDAAADEIASRVAHFRDLLRG